MTIRHVFLPFLIVSIDSADGIRMRHASPRFNSSGAPLRRPRWRRHRRPPLPRCRRVFPSPNPRHRRPRRRAKAGARCGRCFERRLASWLSASRSTARCTTWRPSRTRRCSMCCATISVSLLPSSAAGSANAVPARCSSTAPRCVPVTRRSAHSGNRRSPRSKASALSIARIPLQSAFIAEQAVQCGYCIPGMIMLAKALLDQKPQPSEAEVRVGLAGNLCRCGAHNRIVRAVLRAASQSTGESRKRRSRETAPRISAAVHNDP